jgi:hypothetical protein
MAESISVTAAGFSKALMSMTDHVTGNVEQVIRKACVDLYRAIVERTPVDTGRAKASWGLSTTGAAAPQADGEYSHSEIMGIIDGYVSDFKFTVHDDQVVITNNLEYIEYLENGTSYQPPRGMVSVSMVEFEAHFNKALSGLDGLGPT